MSYTLLTPKRHPLSKVRHFACNGRIISVKECPARPSDGLRCNGENSGGSKGGGKGGSTGSSSRASREEERIWSPHHKVHGLYLLYGLVMVSMICYMVYMVY